MAYDARFQGLEHVVLQIVVILIEALLGASGCGDGGGIGELVVVDGDAVDVVDGADEVVGQGGCEEGLDEGGVGRADEFCFEADEDVDLGGVGLLEAAGFEEVGFVAGGKDLEGGLGVGFLVERG